MNERLEAIKEECAFPFRLCRAEIKLGISYVRSIREGSEVDINSPLSEPDQPGIPVFELDIDTIRRLQAA